MVAVSAGLATAVVALFQAVLAWVSVGQTLWSNLFAPILWLLGL